MRHRAGLAALLLTLVLLGSYSATRPGGPLAPAGPAEVDLSRSPWADGFPPGAVARFAPVGLAVGPSDVPVVWGATFSPDAARIVVLLPDGELRLWDIRSGTELVRFPRQRVPAPPDPARRPLSYPVQFPIDPRRPVFCAQGDLVIGDGGAVWDAATGHPLPGFGLPPPADGPRLTSPTLSPDGRTVAFVTEPGTDGARVTLFDVHSRDERGRFGRGSRVSYPLLFSPDRKTLVGYKPSITGPTPTGGPRWWNRPGHPPGLVFWNLETGEVRDRPAPLLGDAPVAFTPDGQYLFTHDRYRIGRWDVPRGEPAGGPFGMWLEAVVPLAGGSRWLGVEKDRLTVWSYPDGAMVGDVRLPVRPAGVVAASRSGRWVATPMVDGTVVVWDGDVLAGLPPKK